MSRTTKLLFEITAVAITVTALLGIIALAVRLSSASHPGSGLAIATSVCTAFFCVFVGVTANRRRTRLDDSASTSTQLR